MLFLVAGPQRVCIGYRIRPDVGPFTGLLFLGLAVSFASGLIGPRTVALLTTSMRPKLPDLLTYLLLQPRIERLPRVY